MCFDTAKRKISNNAAIPAKRYGFTKQKHIRGDKTLKIKHNGPNVNINVGSRGVSPGSRGGSPGWVARPLLLSLLSTRKSQQAAHRTQGPKYAAWHLLALTKVAKMSKYRPCLFIWVRFLVKV